MRSKNKVREPGMKFKTKITRRSKVKTEPRLQQCQGIFALAPAVSQQLVWDVDVTIPDTWSVGAIVGESGSGKTTVARELARLMGAQLTEAKDAEGNLIEPFKWDRRRAVCAQTQLPIREWTGL